MKKRLCVFLALAAVSAAVIIMFASCSSGRVVYERPERKLASTGKSWTVLVYMCGGENESSTGAYSERLKQMMNVDYPENINVVVQTGGSKEWHIKGIYSDYIQRFEVGKDTLYLADQSASANMGDDAALSDFLKWGRANYKADNYMLILSGSGSGSIHGMAYDELNNDDSLTVDEIAYAMSKAGKDFDILGFDSSLMGSIETAAAVSAYAKYFVASQEIQSGDGWDYEGVLSYICSNPSASYIDICKNICNTYYKKCEENKFAPYATMSVVDMSKISTLNQAFDGMAGNMLMSTDSLEKYVGLTRNIDSAHIYGGATEDEGYSNMMDVGDLAAKVKEEAGNTSSLFLKTMNDAVVYRVNGEYQKNATGMSVYYPINHDERELQKYMDISLSNKYKELLKKICIDCSVTDKADTDDYSSSWSWSTYKEDMQSMEYKSIRDNNSYELNILGNMKMFKDISMNVYKKDDDTGKYGFVGKYDNIESKWDAGIFKDNFDGKLPKLFGEHISMRLVRSYEDYAVYAVPVVMDSKWGSVRIMKNYADGEYTVLGFWGGVDKNGKAADGIKEIGFFDSIKPQLKEYDEEHKSLNYIEGSSSMKMFSGAADKKVDNGEYIFEFDLTDIYGLHRWGTPVKGKVSGGKIYLE